jgi:hypothetical protein
MATKTLRVFAEYTSTGFVPMPTAGNIDYGFTLGSTFPATTPATYQTDNPDLVVTVSAMTDFYVWIRINGQAWNPSYTRNVRVYPDSPNINNVVVNMIIATGPAGVGAYTQLVQTSNRLYFNGATTDATYNSKFAGKTYINELNFGTAPGLATVATSGAYADLTGKPTLATVATSGLFTDLSSKPSGTAPLSYNSGTNSFVITQANTSTNGYLSSTDWNTFNNKLATPAGTTLQYVDGTGALQTFPLLASADKLVINVRNNSGVSMPKGSVVYINGATGNKPTVALAQANSDASSAQTLGLLQTTLANNAEGNVVIVGSVIDLNTSAFSEGQQLYLSPTTAGAYTTTKPYAPSHLVYVGIVTRSHVSLGTIDVKVQNGYEMDELHNVSAQSPSNNDGLFYNTTTSLWEKKSIATVLGYTPYNGTDTSIKALFSATTPLSYSNGVYGISQATTASNGYLSSTDWNTFNNKESVLSFTTPLVRTTNTISINQASASTSGFLSSTDWNTFNNKGTGTGSVTSVAMTMPLGLSVSGSPITTSGTFGITLTAGYVIPSTTSAGQWDTAYTNRITSLTVTGSSGASTLASNVLNIPTYTLSGLGGQVALNGTGFVKISGTTISYDNASYLPLTGSTMSGSIGFSDSALLKRGMYGTMGGSDYWFIGASATATNSGYIEIATGDDGTEPIYIRQYGGDPYTTGTVARTATILDGSGNTTFPNTLTATTLVKSGGTSLQYLMADGSVSTITNNITGTGTTNYVPKFTSGSVIGNSLVRDDGTYVSVGVAPTSVGMFTIYNGSGSTDNGVTRSSLYLNAPTANANIIRFSGAIATDMIFGRFGNYDGLSIGTTGGTEIARFTSAGNLGLGVTPSAWGGNNKAIEGAYGTSYSFDLNVPIAHIASNAYNNGTNWIYKISAPASRYIVNGWTGEHIWYNAPSGTAGNAISFTQAMTLFANGNLAVGTATDSGYKLDVSGTGRFSSDVTLSSTGNAFVLLNNTTTTTGKQWRLSSGSNGSFFITQPGVADVLTLAPTTGAATFSSSVTAGGGTSSGYATLNLISSGTGSARYASIRKNYDSPFDLRIRASNSESAAPIVFDLSNAVEAMRITSGGNILIGTGTDNGYKLYVTGTIYATGNITANSDLTLKKNLKLIDNPIDKLMQLNGYAYQWKSDDSHQYGVIAQEVEKILPYAVSTGNDGIKGVSYNQIIPVLIEAIKVQNKRIVELESKLA